MATFLSTTARIIVGLNGPVSALIKQTPPGSQPENLGVLPITILSEQEINRVFDQPQNDYLRKIIAGPLVDTVKTDRAIIKSGDSVKKQRVFIDVTQTTLHDKQKQTTSEATKANISAIKGSLNQQWKMLQTVEETLRYEEKKLEGIQEGFTLATTYSNQWVDFRKKQLDLLLVEINKLLEKEGLSLPQAEVDNFKLQDFNHLEATFMDRVIVTQDIRQDKLEKIIHLKEPDIDTYFRKKAYLTIRSVLPSSEGMEDRMRQLDNIFQQINDEGHGLQQQQAPEINAMNNEVQPVLKVAQDTTTILMRMDKDRAPLLESVTSMKEVDTILATTEQRLSEEAAQPRRPR